MAQRKFIHVDQLPIAVAKFLQESGFVGIQLQTDGPCMMRCDAISKSSFDKLVESLQDDDEIPLIKNGEYSGMAKDRAKDFLEGSC